MVLRMSCWKGIRSLSQKQEEMRGNVKQAQEERVWVMPGAGALSLLMRRVIMYWQLFADYRLRTWSIGDNYLSLE